MIEPIGRAAAAAAAYGAHPARLTPPTAAASPAASVTPFAATEQAAEAAGATESTFGAFLDRQVTQAVDTLKEGERMSLAAVAGKASAHEVVRSVLAAEMTVQTVVSIRDRMVQAYQDVMRMAI